MGSRGGRSAGPGSSRGVVRIVGGRYKRTPVPVADREGLRPTPERVRETLFDWLRHLFGTLEGLVCCDMFAGSGALGLEAASRGARRVVSLELDRRGALALRAVVDKLKAADVLEVVQCDAFVWLQRNQEKFDVVFIDPPFAAGLQKKAVAAALGHLAAGGLIYLESDADYDEEALSEMGVKSVRAGRAGAVFYRLVAPIADARGS